MSVYDGLLPHVGSYIPSPREVEPDKFAFNRPNYTEAQLAAIKRLTVKQRRFVDVFLHTLNSGIAAQEAGYTDDAEDTTTGNRILAKTYIAQAIELFIAERFEAPPVTPDMIVSELNKVGFAPVSDTVPANAKVAALRLSGATHGLFNNTKVQVEGQIEIPIPISAIEIIAVPSGCYDPNEGEPKQIEGEVIKLVPDADGDE